jgi:sarcosine oxidase delta subunit
MVLVRWAWCGYCESVQRYEFEVGGDVEDESTRNNPFPDDDLDLANWFTGMNRG